jgi:predicted nucleotidyltransferase
VLEQIRGHAKKYRIQKVILFGSRARGAFHRDSDIDLAVSGRNADLFRLSVEEETDTLLTYDVVDLDHIVSAELLDVIRKEGIVLYEEV